MTDQVLLQRIEDLVKRADQLVKDHFDRMKFVQKPPIHRAEISSSWAKIITQEERNGTYVDGSVYAFVALKTKTSKNLGFVVAGDIHKAASYNTPAKHKRGSVFDENFNNCLTEYGIVYMR